ncbi:response regulator transcription factor [Planktotalea sp.]|uniref:response regulator transcription factor n=1 Tax=Planktotalea sp. TaxID=2029877 RepID=UPI0032993F19
MMTGRERHYAIVADDHAIVRAGIRDALEKPGLVTADGLHVIDEAADGLAAIASVRQHKPDLLMLDVQMPMAGGVETMIEVRRWSPDTKIVVLTGVTAVGLVSSIVDAGVDGLFSKADDNSELYAKLPGILQGQRYIAVSFMKILEDSAETEVLTGRERQMLNLILSGQSNKDIAENLGISVKTVDKHRTSMMQKLGVHSVPQLMAYALREGLIDPSAL